jgi:hypothetical protein
MASGIFSAPEIGSAQAVGVKNNGIKEYTHDIIYPVSDIRRAQFTANKQLEFRWRSDSSRYFLPSQSKMVVSYEVAFGDPAGSRFLTDTLHDDVRITAAPNTCIFDGGMRYSQNSVTVENQTQPYTAAMTSLLMKSDLAGTDTSGSNSLLTLRKDVYKQLTGKAGGTVDLTAAPYSNNVTPAMLVDNAAVQALKFVDVLQSIKALQGSQGRADNVNPKQEILSLGYDSNQTPGEGIAKFQVSEPLIGLQSFSHSYAVGPSDHQLFCTVSPTFANDLLHSVNDTDWTTVTNDMPAYGSAAAKTIYVQIASVEFHACFVSPSIPFVPRSLSIKWSPMQVSTRLLQSNIVNESIVVSPACRMVVCGLRQRVSDIWADKEELGLAGVGKSEISGETVYGFSDWQAQLGSGMAPSPAYGALDTKTGQMARPYADYLSAIGKSLGLRGSTLTYADYTGYHNTNGACGTALGDKGCTFMVRLLSPPNSLSNQLNIRGTLNGNPAASAQEEMVVIVISDSLLNVEWAQGSSMPISTSVNAII